MGDISEKSKINRIRIVYLLAFIFSLTGAILLFAEDFLEWYEYHPFPQPDEYGWIHIDSEIYGPIIIMVAIFLLFCTFISTVGLYNPKFVNKYTLNVNDSKSVEFPIIGIMIAAGDLEEKSSWNPDAGFYGAILGGLLTMIFFSTAFWLTKKGGIQETSISRPKVLVKTALKAKYCHKCGKEVSGKFCTYCGTEMRGIQEYKVTDSMVPKVEHCPKCRKEVSGKFCTYCGTNLNNIQEQELSESTVPNVRYCSKCGKEVSGKFCTYCGTNLI